MFGIKHKVQKVVMDRLMRLTGDRARLIAAAEAKMMRLAIEVTNICNANCSFCAYRYMERPKCVMSNDQFAHLLQRYAEYGGGELKFTPIVGDPLVDRDLICKIKMANEIPQIRYKYIYTNLIGLDQFDVTDLLLSGIDEIYISTTIGDRDMFKRIYGVDKYDLVMRNLKMLINENAKLGGKVGIHITLRCEKPYSHVYAGADYKEIKRLHRGKIWMLDDAYDNWTGAITEEDLPKGQRFRKLGKVVEPCSLFYKGLIILANGDVGACWCRDYDGKLIVGNIYESSLDDIWTGEKMKALRQNWYNGNMPKICRNCYQYTSLTDFLLSNKSRLPAEAPV